jgi:hypothetical protein
VEQPREPVKYDGGPRDKRGRYCNPEKPRQSEREIKRRIFEEYLLNEFGWVASWNATQG